MKQYVKIFTAVSDVKNAKTVVEKAINNYLKERPYDTISQIIPYGNGDLLVVFNTKH